MLTAYISGLPISAKEIFQDAMNEAYGENAVDVQELSSEKLRSRVRLSLKNVNVIAVVLDRVSSDTCKDIEGGLYSSDKYYTYIEDSEFVKYLNGKFGISLEYVEEDLETVQPVIAETSHREFESISARFEEKLSIKDSIIHNLEQRIKDLSYLGGISSVEDTKEVESLREEILNLNGQILDVKSALTMKEGEVTSNEKIISEYKEKILQTETRLKKVTKDLERVSAEVDEFRISSSTQEGIIRDKNSLIHNYESKLKALSSVKDSLAAAHEEITLVKKQLVDKERVIANMSIDFDSKNKEIARYVSELESVRNLQGVSEKLDSANGTITSLKSELEVMTNDYNTLKKTVGEKDRTISQLSETITSKEVEIEEAEKIRQDLEKRASEDDTNISILNKTNLELQSALAASRQSSTGSSEEYDRVVKELSTLKSKEKEMSESVFNQIGQYALPNSSLKCKVLQGSGHLNNVRFAFAGSSGSRKGAYKCIREDLVYKKDNCKYLILDLVTETSIDYVFEINKVVAGIDWLRKGGSVQPYISSTSLQNVKVMSMGLSYVNDGYFLNIDWSKRITELENSGYKVIVFCGDLSNMVTRVLHESFVGFGESTIYVEGSSIGARTVITNLRGLWFAKKDLVAYFAFNPSSKKFYDMVEKTYDCVILNNR